MHNTYIFLHIPKTAGSTFGYIIKYNFGFISFFNKYFLGKKYTYYNLPGVQFTKNGSTYDYLNTLDKIPIQDKMQIKILRGHIHFGIHEKLPNKCTYLTFLRDPIDRVLSLYYYIKSTPSHPYYKIVNEKKISLEDFLVHPFTAEIDNAQTRMLSGHYFNIPIGKCSDEMLEKAKFNLKKNIDFIGITEMFNESLYILKHKFKWKYLFYSKINQTKKKSKKDNITPNTLKLIEKNNLLDIELYNYALELFNEQLKKYNYKIRTNYDLQNSKFVLFTSFYNLINKIAHILFKVKK